MSAAKRTILCAIGLLVEPWIFAYFMRDMRALDWMHAPTFLTGVLIWGALLFSTIANANLWDKERQND